VLGILGSLSLSGNAQALNSNNSGTACRNYNAAQVADIDCVASGARNLNASSRYVICPIVRSTTSASNAVNVYVDGFASSGKTISCPLYSYDYNGAFLGSQSFPAARTGAFAALTVRLAQMYARTRWHAQRQPERMQVEWSRCSISPAGHRSNLVRQHIVCHPERFEH
jgi:hypothetical protein